MGIASAVAASVLSALALGHMARPGRIPGDRLIANLTARLKSDPGNANIYYSIGRAHYASYSRNVESFMAKKGEVLVYQRGNELPQFYGADGYIFPWDGKSTTKDTPDNRRHIQGAIRNLRTALDMTERPTRSTRVPADAALAHLTLACTFDSGAYLAPKIKLSDPYKGLTTTKQWRAMAANEYLQAFRASIGKDEKSPYRWLSGLNGFIAYEAGIAFIGLRPDAKERTEVEAGIQKLRNLPLSTAITPLILDLTESKPLSSLLVPSRKIQFDLDGTGRPQTYGWVKPTTAFLVWDPGHEGKVTSGRQLFGNATWWMLWANAYSALDALDDNHDGWLSGKELHGLALWYDRNGNGICDPGEVIPIEQTPIAALRTSFDAREGDSYVSIKGVRLKDGRYLPTYDWVTSASRR